MIEALADLHLGSDRLLQNVLKCSLLTMHLMLCLSSFDKFMHDVRICKVAMTCLRTRPKQDFVKKKKKSQGQHYGMGAYLIVLGD